MSSKDDSGSIVMDIVGVLVVLGLLFFWFVWPIIQIANGSGASEPYYDNTDELEAQDANARGWVEDEERKQRQREWQDEHDDYLLWLRETGGR